MAVKYIHTSITAKDWEALVNFYVDALACKIQPPERHMAGDWLETGTGVVGAEISGVHLLLPGYGPNGPTLEVFQYGQNIAKAEPPMANREGIAHLAFHVDDLSSVLEKIIALGGRKLGDIAYKDFPEGSLAFVYATDTEGNIIEIQCWENR